jgi:hypothetical protein
LSEGLVLYFVKGLAHIIGGWSEDQKAVGFYFAWLGTEIPSYYGFKPHDVAGAAAEMYKKRKCGSKQTQRM